MSAFGKDAAPPLNHRDTCAIADQNGCMDDHYEHCEGISYKCWDDTAYKPRRKRNPRAAKTPFSGSIPGSGGKRRRPEDKPLSMTGEEYAARLWRQTDISLRKHPERWQLKNVKDASHYQLTPLGERRRVGRV
jgi:hypothetical protein